MIAETTFLCSQYVSYVTEGLSILFLVVTTGALLLVRRTVHNDRTFVQINLCVALILLHLTSTLHDLFVSNARLCEVYTVVLHFFLLASGK